MEVSRNNKSGVREVFIDGLAVLKIVKHCNESAPTLVAGSLLGAERDGVLEITYSYAFPVQKSEGHSGDDELEGAEYQMEMMRMLGEVNVDNNCVGWYQSMHLGTMCTQEVVNYQYSYQSSEELSENSVVLMYDPAQSHKGTMVLKAFRLTDKFMELKRKRFNNKFIPPSDILEEIPLRISNIGYVSAYLRCFQDTHQPMMNCDFEPLSLSVPDNNPQQYIELIGSAVEDIVSEQVSFQRFANGFSKLRQDHLKWLSKRLSENAHAKSLGHEPKSIRIADSGYKLLPDAPPRLDHLLTVGQVDLYCKQVEDLVGNNMQKMLLTSQLNSGV